MLEGELNILDILELTLIIGNAASDWIGDTSTVVVATQNTTISCVHRAVHEASYSPAILVLNVCGHPRGTNASHAVGPHPRFRATLHLSKRSLIWPSAGTSREANERLKSFVGHNFKDLP